LCKSLSFYLLWYLNIWEINDIKIIRAWPLLCSSFLTWDSNKLQTRRKEWFIKIFIHFSQTELKKKLLKCKFTEIYDLLSNKRLIFILIQWFSNHNSPPDFLTRSPTFQTLCNSSSFPKKFFILVIKFFKLVLHLIYILYLK
jgi:hypothetical protein